MRFLRKNLVGFLMPPFDLDRLARELASSPDLARLSLAVAWHPELSGKELQALKAKTRVMRSRLR